MKLIKIVAILLIALGLNAAENPAKADYVANMKALHKIVPSISPQKLMEWNKSGKDFILLDVRDYDEVMLGNIDAEVFRKISRGKLEFGAIKNNLIPQDKTVVLYCTGGGRGALSTKVLIDYGYKDVYNLTGGFKGWLKAGYPFVNKYGTFKKVADSETGVE